jgi:hypothetical protein
VTLDDEITNGARGVALSAIEEQITLIHMEQRGRLHPMDDYLTQFAAELLQIRRELGAAWNWPEPKIRATLTEEP